MKKLMMMAMMLVASAAAFAGTSPALKAITKEKSYESAEALLKSSFDQLTDDQEKGKAYSHIMDLAYKVYAAESKKIVENSMNKQFGKPEVPVDNDLVVKYGQYAIEAAKECAKYDTKYAEDHKKRLVPVFNDIVNLGIQAAESQKTEEAFKYLDAYFSGVNDPLFNGYTAITGNPNKGAAAFYGGRSAYLLKNYEKACDLLKIGIQDTIKQVQDYSFSFLMESMDAMRKTKEDSVKYQNDLKTLYAQYPENEIVFSRLVDTYTLANDYATVYDICDKHQANYPNAVMPHIYRAFAMEQEKKYDEAIAEWSLIPETQTNYANFVYHRGVCKFFKANEFNEANADNRTGRLTPENEKKYQDMLQTALTDFEKAKELDPDQKVVKWAYILKNIYIATGQQAKADALD